MGLVIEKAPTATIEDNVLYETNSAAIYISGSGSSYAVVRINKNRIKSTYAYTTMKAADLTTDEKYGNGLMLLHGSYAEVYENTISESANAAVFFDSSSGTVDENKLSENAIAIVAQGLDDGEVEVGRANEYEENEKDVLSFDDSPFEIPSLPSRMGTVRKGSGEN